MLTQIRLHHDPEEAKQRMIGVEVVAFNHQGEAWRLSTIDNWKLIGNCQPAPDVEEKLKNFCRQVFELFSS